MEITNPRRILAVSLESSTEQLSKVIKDLTGTYPGPSNDSLAGVTHDLHLQTAYYTAQVPIWLDVVSSPAEEWATTFLSPEAREVLEVLGGLVVVFAIPSSTADAGPTRDFLRQVGRVVRDGLGGWAWDGVGIGLGVGPAEEADIDEWDGCCAEFGLEFVHVSGPTSDKRNEFGEKVGVARALEALEANDWAQVGGNADSDFGDFLDGEHLGNEKEGDEDGRDGVEKGDLDPASLEFGFDKADFEGLRQAIWSAGRDGGHIDGPDGDADPGRDPDEQDVQKLEGMMRKLQAVRDSSAGLPEEQRRRLAKRAVDEVMKEL